MPRSLRFLLCLTCLISVPAGVFASDAPIRGAGSSAAKYVYQAWGQRFLAQTGIALEYEAVGSSEGIRRIIDRKVQFGASDVAPDQTVLDQQSLVLVPTVVTGAVPVVNLPDLTGVRLKLDGPTLAAIFSGDIVRWDTPAIAALNPDIQLPALPIHPIARADGSGTTHNFTDYLSKVSPQWRDAFGTGKQIRWAEGVATAKGSGGVVSALQRTPGGITYVDHSYVLKHKLTPVAMRNKAGRFVAPAAETFRSALMNSPWQTTGDFSQTLTDMPGAESWPITMGTFVLLPRTIGEREAGRDIVRFFLWAFMNGDALAAEADFVRLPDPVQAKAYKALASIRDGAGNVLAYDALAK